MFCSGLGELICLKFAKEGADVAINYVAAADRAEGVRAKIEKESGGKAFVIQGVSWCSIASYLSFRLD